MNVCVREREREIEVERGKREGREREERDRERENERERVITWKGIHWKVKEIITRNYYTKLSHEIITRNYHLLNCIITQKWVTYRYTAYLKSKAIYNH